MSPNRLREGAVDLDFDLEGIVVGLVLTIVVWILAPVLVVVLAALLLPVELLLLLVLGVVLLLVRFAGIVPWTVTTVNTTTGIEASESFRFLPSAVRRVRVRWSWT